MFEDNIAKMRIKLIKDMKKVQLVIAGVLTPPGMIVTILTNNRWWLMLAFFPVIIVLMAENTITFYRSAAAQYIVKQYNYIYSHENKKEKNS